MTTHTKPALVAIHPYPNAVEAGVVLSILAGQVQAASADGWKALVMRQPLPSDTPSTADVLNAVADLAARRGEHVTILQSEVA